MARKTTAPRPAMTPTATASGPMAHQASDGGSGALTRCLGLRAARVVSWNAIPRRVPALPQGALRVAPEASMGFWKIVDHPTEGARSPASGPDMPALYAVRTCGPPPAHGRVPALDPHAWRAARVPCYHPPGAPRRQRRESEGWGSSTAGWWW